MRRTGLSMGATFSAIWLGETISIGVMEVMMNAIDYDLGGVRTGSIFHPQFWSALIVAIIAGFLAAWPVNAWLIAKQLRKGH